MRASRYARITLSALSRVGACVCCTSGALDMMYSIICAARSPGGVLVYSPPIHAGSLRMASIAIVRIIRLRPAICAGTHAYGASPSMNSG